jgi:GT2 family glycosyltransferase
MSLNPLVTIMIATSDRHAELAATLCAMRRQDYQSVEMIVIDDASTPPINPIVERYWPEARLIRHEINRGQSARRNEGFRLANGEYILQLDDDCSLPAADGISMSVAYMERTPDCAGIVYRNLQGDELLADVTSEKGPGNCVTFVGAAVFLRKASLQETAGYRESFIGAEEEELSLQLLKRGWSLSYRPEIAALHLCSLRNRNWPIRWKLTLRNNLWTILIHCPISRIPLEAGWKIAVAARDAFGRQRGRLFYEALVEAVKGVGNVWKLRDPLDRLSLRRYDALRAYGVLPYAIFQDPPAHNWTSLRLWAKHRRMSASRSIDPKNESGTISAGSS